MVSQENKKGKILALEIKSPNKYNQSKLTIFLAGSIDMGFADNWQDRIVNELKDYDVLLLNPGRDDWDSSWKQTKDDLKFLEQVQWEQRGLKNADFRIFVFLKNSKSPITLLELGKHLTDYGAVCCEQGFYRKGNVDIEVAAAHMPLFNTIDGLIAHVKKMLDFHLA